MAGSHTRRALAAAAETSLRRKAAVTVVLLVAATANADPDRWLGSDKAIHFAFSSGLAIGGYAAAATFSDSRTVRVGYGASVALLAGIGKELWDASGNGNASIKDLTWDVLGTMVGLALCWVVDALFFEPGDAPATLAFARW